MTLRGITKRMGFGALGICLTASIVCAPAHAAASGNENAAETLERMAGIEARIDALQERQREQERDLLDANRSMQETETRLEERGQTVSQGDAYLAERNRRRREASERLLAERVKTRHEFDDARRTSGRAAVAWAALGQTAPAETAIAMLQLNRRSQDRAFLASRALLRIEGEAAGAEAGVADAERTHRQYNAFTELGIKALRERHAQLAERLDQLQQVSSQRDAELEKLRIQRDELKTLVAKLAEEEAARLATEAEKMNLTGVEPETNESGTPEAAATPQTAIADSNAAPTIAIELDSEPINAQTEGVRRLFWRASPVGVRAVASGRVVFAAPFAGYRHLLIIDHGNGWRTLYGNLVSCGVQSEQQVEAGAPLGEYRAAQGKRAEPLWFEVRQGANPVEPSTWPVLGADWERRLFFVRP